MTEEEWDAICLHLDLAFAGEWDDDKADAYATFLGALEASDVMGALHVLAQGGQKFTPSVGEIMGVIDQAHGPPPFDKAWQEVRRAISTWVVWGDRPRARALLGESHPAVLDWLDAYGWDRMRGEEVDSPEYGGAIMHRISKSYGEHVADFRLRERAERRGLPGAPVRQLEEGAGGD